MPRSATRRGASLHLMLVASALLGLSLAFAGDSAAQPITLEEASKKVYDAIAELPRPDRWHTDPAMRFRLEPVGGGVFELCEDAGDGDDCRRMCATATRTRTDVTRCSPTTNLHRVRLHVLVRGFGGKVTAEEVFLRARRGAGISITTRDVVLRRAGGKEEPAHSLWFHNWLWPDPQLLLVLSREPPEDDPWFPRVSGKKAGSDEASIAVKLPGLLPEYNKDPLFSPAGLRALQSCLIEGGAVAGASLVALDLKSNTLGLVLGRIGAGKPALFGTELPCTRTNGCAKDPVNVKLGILKVTGERGAVRAAKARGVLEFHREPVVTCDHDDAAYFIVPRPDRTQFPTFDQKKNEALQLSFSPRGARVRPGETIVFGDSQALRELEATLKEKAEYTVLFRPRRDDGKSVGAKEAERYIGGAAFSVRAEGRKEEKATVSAMEDGKHLKLSATVALQPDEEPDIEVPPDREGLKLGKPEIPDIKDKRPRQIVYPLTLPAAAFEPITVALEPKRALYGKEEAARSYPGRNCRMQLEVGRRKLRVAYGRDGRGVVLKLFEGTGAPPSLMEARKDLADIDRVEARVLRYPDEGFRKDSDGRPCEGELAVANVKLDDRRGRLTGSLRLPLERPILLGLVAPKTAGEFEAPHGNVRKLADRIALQFVRAMDAAYGRELAAWSTADVLAVAGGDANLSDVASALPERLMAGGLRDETKPDNLLLVADWQAALGRGWESGIAAQAIDFRAVIEAYRRRHGLAAEGQARITVLGFVSSSARRCGRWIEELESLGPDVSVRLLIADDTRRDVDTEIRIAECPSGRERGDRGRRVRVYTFPFAAAVQQRVEDVLAQLQLGQRLEEWMRQ